MLQEKREYGPKSADEAMRTASKVTTSDAAKKTAALEEKRIRDEEAWNEMPHDYAKRKRNLESKVESAKRESVSKTRLSNMTDTQKAEAKKLADKRWYQRNKGHKAEYNRQYYEDNVDYWRQRYLAGKAKVGRDVTYDVKEYEINRINMDRALKELNWYEQNYAKVPFTEMWTSEVLKVTRDGWEFLKKKFNEHYDKKIADIMNDKLKEHGYYKY